MVSRPFHGAKTNRRSFACSATCKTGHTMHHDFVWEFTGRRPLLIEEFSDRNETGRLRRRYACAYYTLFRYQRSTMQERRYCSELTQRRSGGQQGKTLVERIEM